MSADNSTPSEEWERPIPLGFDEELPTFPVETLPGWLADMVGALAEATQTPVDLAAVLSLCALATGAGGRAVVEVRRGWREPLNLYAVVAMPPGSRKTAVFNLIAAPLLAWEREAVEGHRVTRIEALTRRKAADDDADRQQTEANKAPKSKREEALKRAAEAHMHAEAIVVPNQPRLLADDATPEALATLLARHGGRIAVLSDEGGVFELMAGRYSKGSGPNLDIYLKGHIGSTLKVDRSGRDHEHIDQPAITLGLAVQPAVLRASAHQPGFRGKGLLARFLWAIPASNVGFRRVGADPVPEHVGRRFDEEVTTLVRSLAEWQDPAVLSFTAEANEVLLDFERDLEPRMRPGADLGHIADWTAKLAGATARLAGLLHLAANVRTGWGHPITDDTVLAAVCISHYFVHHAVAAFDHMGADPVLDDARTLTAWLRGRASFTRRDAHRAHLSRFPKVTDLDPVLDVLEAHHWIRRRPDPKPGPSGGRPPSPTYHVNPVCRDRTSTTDGTRP